MCVLRFNTNECSSKSFDDIKQEAVQETLNRPENEICKNINNNSLCKPDEREYNNTSVHNIIDNSFNEQTFNYSPYVLVILLLMVLVILAFCIVKVIKKRTRERQADLQRICYNVEYHA